MTKMQHQTLALIHLITFCPTHPQMRLQYVGPSLSALHFTSQLKAAKDATFEGQNTAKLNLESIQLLWCDSELSLNLHHAQEVSYPDFHLNRWALADDFVEATTFKAAPELEAVFAF